MKGRLIICSLLLSSITSFAQFEKNIENYYEHINNGKISYVKKNYGVAIQDYLNAFKIFEPNRNDLDFLAYLYDLNKDSVNALKFYKISILNGMPVSIANFPSYILSKKGTDEYSAFIRSLDSLNTEFDKRSDIQFALFIKELYTRDQFARELLDYQIDSTKMNFKLWQGLILAVDTNNMNSFMNYADQYGIPNSLKINAETEKEFKFLIHHFIQYKEEGKGNIVALSEKIRNLIKKKIYSGELPNTFLYNALDREYSLLHKQQLYGTFYVYTKDHKVTYDNIYDVKNVDKRRREWLLLPLYWDMKFNFDTSFVYPQGYTFKTL